MHDDDLDLEPTPGGTPPWLVPVGTSLVVLLVGGFVGFAAAWTLKEPERIEVPVPRELTAAELEAACEPMVQEAAASLEEAQGKVTDLETQVRLKESQVASLEDEMAKRASKGAAIVRQLEAARAELATLQRQLEQAVAEKEALVVELRETKEELAVQKVKTKKAKDDAVAQGWLALSGQAKIDICDRGNRKKLGRCRETIDEKLTPDLKSKYEHCVRSNQAVPSVREVGKGETLPQFAEWLGEDSNVTSGWYILLCDPTLPEADDFRFEPPAVVPVSSDLGGSDDLELPDLDD